MLDQAAQNKIEESAKSDENQPQKQIEDKKKDQSPAIFLRGKKTNKPRKFKALLIILEKLIVSFYGPPPKLLML